MKQTIIYRYMYANLKVEQNVYFDIDLVFNI